MAGDARLVLILAPDGHGSAAASRAGLHVEDPLLAAAAQAEGMALTEETRTESGIDKAFMS